MVIGGQGGDSDSELIEENADTLLSEKGRGRKKEGALF